MTITTVPPSSVVMFQPFLRNTYDQKSMRGKPGSWHLSYKMSLARTCRSVCGLIMFCDILTCSYFIIDLEQLKTDKEIRSFICKKCLEKQ
jgi:hypothetical protein